MAEPTLAVNDKVLVTLEGEMFGQTILSTYWYQCVSMTGTPDLDDALTALNTYLDQAAKLYATFVSCTPPSYTLKNAWLQRIEPQRVRKNVYIVNRVGTYAGSAYTANVAAVISRYGHLAGRSHQGSLHVPIGTTDDAISAGLILEPLRAILAEHATEMKAIPSTGAGAILWQPILNNGPGSVNVTPIVGTTVRQTVRIMRRRTVGLGI